MIASRGGFLPVSSAVPRKTPKGRASGLRFGDTPLSDLLNAIVLFALLPAVLPIATLRSKLAPLRGSQPQGPLPSQMTLSFAVSACTASSSVCLARTATSSLTLAVASLCITPGPTRGSSVRLAIVLPKDYLPRSPLRTAFDALDKAVHHFCVEEKLTA